MRPWQIVLMIAVAAVLALTVGWQPFWLITYALAVAFALSLLWMAFGTQGLTFSRSSSGGRAQVGERIEERLSLENHSFLPKLWVQVYDGSTVPGHHAGYVSSVGAHQRISWRARTVLRRRGRYTLGPVVAGTGDPLGLFYRELTLAPEQPLLVLPTVLPLAAFELFPGMMPGRGRGSRRSLQTTTNVVTVRGYVPGDALTRIHWPSTARTGQLMVKEFDLDPTIDVVLLVDLDLGAQAGQDDGSTEEYAVTIAASIASYLLRHQELAVGLTVCGARDAQLPLDRGERQIERVMERLAMAHAEQRTRLVVALSIEETRVARNTVLVVITPSAETEWTQSLRHLQRRGVRPTVILLDPHSFDEARPSSAPVHEALVSMGVPVIPVRRGDPLVHVLEQGPR